LPRRPGRRRRSRTRRCADLALRGNAGGGTVTTVVAGTNQKSIPRACGLLASIVVLAACSGSSGQLNETEPTRFPEGAVETSVSQNRDDPTDIRSPATIREDPVAATLREQSQAISACAAEEGVSV